MNENGYNVILFDGVCNLCNTVVQFVIKRDKKNYFHFASLQSDFGQQLLQQYHLPVKEFSSFVLFTRHKVFSRSTAALLVAKKLGGFWSLLSVFIIVPPVIRDGIYNFIATNRYKWFGKKEACWVPSPELKKRFLG